MFRMLIVDDEPIIVEGLVDVFKEHEGPNEYDVHAAYSAEAALTIASRMKIDIVLSDIEMPGMNGLDLHVEMKKIWPHCKVVFLTGYNDFDYIQTAIRNGGADYVLKTEGDEQIIRAVNHACDTLSSELEEKKLLASATDQLREALPYRQKEYLQDMLYGLDVNEKQRSKRLEELEVCLDAEAPLLMVVGRVDRWPDDVLRSERALLLFAIRNIAEEFLKARLRMAHVNFQKERWVWLLQPIMGQAQPEPATDTARFIQGCLESIQTQSKKLLRIPCSFVMDRTPFNWSQLPEKFDLLKWRLNLGLGAGEEMILTDSSESKTDSPHRRTHLYATKINHLETLLESGQRQEFLSNFTELMDEISSVDQSKHGMIYEVYYSLVVMVLACINRWELMSAISAEINMDKLTKIEEHSTWQDISEYFQHIAELFFQYRQQEFMQKTHDVVGQVHDYVLRHLDGDVSQSKLAEIVYLSPAYLSRLYKQTTGLSLSEYITNARIGKAKELLLDTPMKIHEIARAVGFDSASYFTRFFKKVTHLTPQEFRDQAQG